MRVIIFGATGMLGGAALIECLRDDDVTEIISVGRVATGQKHPKLRELVHGNLGDLSAIEGELVDCDACFFCLGVSAAGMKEADYRRITYDYTLAAAEALARQSPGIVFVYLSGAGTDSSETSRTMWARVKGQTENALLKQSFIDGYMFRPGYIQPVNGAVSKTLLYRFIYAVMGPLFPLWRRIFPRHVTTTESVARAMLKVARTRPAQHVFSTGDIEALATAKREPPQIAPVSPG